MLILPAHHQEIDPAHARALHGDHHVVGGERRRIGWRLLFEAELLIEGGWVRVDGERVELPQVRVGAQEARVLGRDDRRRQLHVEMGQYCLPERLPGVGQRVCRD